MENIQNEHFEIRERSKDLVSSGLTLAGALHQVMEASRESHMDRNLYHSVRQTESELDYLTSRLGLSEEGVILFSILCEKGAQRKLAIYDISGHLGCGSLEVLQHKPLLDSLVERGLVAEVPTNRYFVPEEVMLAIGRNEVWGDEVHVHTSDGDLYRDIFERFVLGSANRISKAAMHKGVLKLLETNSRLHFAKVTARYRDTLDEDEFMFLLSLVCLWLVKGLQWTTFARASMILRDNVRANKVLANLLNGTSPLLARGIVAAHTADSFATKQGFRLTNATMRELRPEGMADDDPLEHLIRAANETVSFEEDSSPNTPLTAPDGIAKRRLFYNSATERQVEELATLLDKKKMRSVQRRLRKSGLRCGFSCLFYGPPGTGKTETVLQLARRSGRAVFRVEVSDLRSRWHGESERLVKKVFDDYRQLAARSEIAPIMLFNEADAIFNRRSDNPEHSSDKCENTIQNIILQEMETLDGILIATTNLANNMDNAFERRFLYKIEFETPDTDTRAKIWRSMMPALDNAKAHLLSEQFPELAGGHIENITRKATVSRVLHGRRTSWDELTEMCRQELLNSRKHNAIGFKPLSNQ